MDDRIQAGLVWDLTVRQADGRLANAGGCSNDQNSSAAKNLKFMVINHVARHSYGCDVFVRIAMP
jgi:hypothetical protein